MFQVGQEVICVDDDGAKQHLKRGRKYVISNVEYNAYVGMTFVDVAGVVVNKPQRCASWFPERFRPIVRRDTDISVFTKLLSKVPEHA